MKLTIYTFSRCSSCIKALKWLDANNIEYININIIETPPEKEILQKALKSIGNRKALFNTSGKSYRTIGSKIINAMNDDEAISALEADGKLIKRPFLLTTTNNFLLGFNPTKWEEVLIKKK